MFANEQDVLELTGKTVTLSDILQANAIIEVAAGKLESEVTGAGDLAWLRYAVSWQAAYMVGSDVISQANVERVQQDNSTVVIGDRLFALAPLAEAGLKRVSWVKTRSLRTGRWEFGSKRVPWWYLW